MNLTDIRVLDLSRTLPGPYATQLLADTGAEIIKIEDTARGDYSRHSAPTTDAGIGRTFDAVNRGKKSVAVDLKKDDGREIFYRLVEDADVVFEQFRPGVTRRLGIHYDKVRTYNDEIIYCSLSGYGHTGALSDRVGHDLNYIGEAGLLDMTRQEPDERPRIPGYPIGDMTGGLVAALSIVSALLSRELGNSSGEYIDVAMTDAVVSLSHAVAKDVFCGDDPRPGQTYLTGDLPWYAVYETADQKYITIAAIELKFWKNLCRAIGREELIEYHGTNDTKIKEAIREELTTVIKERTRAEWDEFLEDKDVMYGTVKTPREMLTGEQFNERDLIIRDGPEDAPPRIGFPAHSTDGINHQSKPVPGHGEHTTKILQEIGFSPSTIESLRSNKVLR